MDAYTNLVVCQLLTLIVTGLFSYILGKTKSLNKSFRDEMSALKQAIKVILRSQIVEAYKTYVQDGEPLTVERRDEIVEAYQAYKTLGGNGTGKQMYEAICEVEITVM
jgi:hypothetical protein